MKEKTTIKPKKVIVPPLRIDGSKYLDQSRFPKVVTNGYEFLFKRKYVESLTNMLKSLTNEMIKIKNV